MSSDSGSGRDKPLGDMSPSELRSDRRVRLAIGGVLGLLGLVFVLQNTNTVALNFLWLEFRMPLIWMSVLMVLLGCALTLLWQWRGRRRSRKS